MSQFGLRDRGGPKPFFSPPSSTRLTDQRASLPSVFIRFPSPFETLSVAPHSPNAGLRLNQGFQGLGVRTKACIWPPTIPVPVICPPSLIPVAILKTHPDPPGMSVFRSVIRPFCHMNARPDVGGSLLAWPTTVP